MKSKNISKQLPGEPGKRLNQTRKFKDRGTMKFTDRSTYYQICLEGKLEERWLCWFEGLEVNASSDDQTIIGGDFDQSALHGLFNRIRDLGVTLISVQRQPGRKDRLLRRFK